MHFSQLRPVKSILSNFPSDYLLCSFPIIQDYYCKLEFFYSLPAIIYYISEIN